MKKGEVGRRIYFDAQFDISTATTLNGILVKPDGTSLTVTPTVQSSPLGSYEANKYATYDTQAGDIDQSGTWQAYLEYNDATPKTYYSDRDTFLVTEV